MRHEMLIEGMLAVHAKHAVFTALGAVAGVTRAEVELGRAEVEHDGSATEGELRAAVEAAGFTVRAVRLLPRSLPML
jgi:copper chaperone CopZ